jgi:hypothetical protein
VSNLQDIHFKVEIEDLKRLKRFCLHRGDLTFLINQAVKRFVGKLEEAEGKMESSKEAKTNGEG